MDIFFSYREADDLLKNVSSELDNIVIDKAYQRQQNTEEHVLSINYPNFAN
jgi:hypothetical protein